MLSPPRISAMSLRIIHVAPEYADSKVCTKCMCTFFPSLIYHHIVWRGPPGRRVQTRESSFQDKLTRFNPPICIRTCAYTMMTRAVKFQVIYSRRSACTTHLHFLPFLSLSLPLSVPPTARAKRTQTARPVCRFAFGRCSEIASPCTPIKCCKSLEKNRLANKLARFSKERLFIGS